MAAGALMDIAARQNLPGLRVMEDSLPVWQRRRIQQLRSDENGHA